MDAQCYAGKVGEDVKGSCTQIEIESYHLSSAFANIFLRNPRTSAPVSGPLSVYGAFSKKFFTEAQLV